MPDMTDEEMNAALVTTAAQAATIIGRAARASIADIVPPGDERHMMAAITLHSFCSYWARPKAIAKILRALADELDQMPDAPQGTKLAPAGFSEKEPDPDVH